VRKEKKVLPVPLSSPATSAVAGGSGPECPPACRVTHGPYDSYFESIEGKTVASVWRSLATVFSIPDDAEAWAGGSVVDGQYRLRAGDSVVFVRTGWGRKEAFGKFGTIQADPAWPYRSPHAIVGNGGRGDPNGQAKHIIQVDAGAHYPLMTLEEIKSLPVKEVAADDAHLYLWTTNSFIVEAHEVARAWGFEPKTILTWVKLKLDRPEPSMKTGYWYRSATEHIVFGVRGGQRLLGPAVPTAFLLPRLPHSEKPEFFYKLIEKQSPGPYLELFARRLRLGWDTWGNEIESTIQLP
jgi:N6-adenosine-specific RNA methylase IME4